MRLNGSVFSELAYAKLTHTKFTGQLRGLDEFVDLFNQADKGLFPALNQPGIRSVLSDSRNVAYMFATAYHETDATLQPVEEKGSKEYLSKYWTRQTLRNQLGNQVPEDATRFKGRGYPQTTGRRNYTLFSKMLGVDLVTHPELAAQPTVAFEMMVLGMAGGLFTGAGFTKNLGVSVDDSSSQEKLKQFFIACRKIINGTDQAEKIAGYALSFLVIIEKARVTDKVVEEVCLPATSEATSQLPAPEIDTPQVIEPTAANPTGPSGISLPEIITKISQGGRKRLTSFLSAMGIGLAGFLEWINSHPIYALVVLVVIIFLVAFFIWIQANLDKHRMTIAADPDKHNVI